jgi:uncharacterized protein with FMN-binding domain
MGAISLVSVVTGVQVGANAKSATGFTPAPTGPTADPTTSPTPTDTSSATPTPTDTSSATPTQSATPTPTSTKTTTPTPTPKPTPTKTTTPKPAATVSHTSSPVYYRFGTVQLTVTKTGSKITDITMDQAGATNGRAAAFPYLVSLALSAQNASFDTSMMSGATYSTDAFMQALNDALSQF